MKSCLLGHVDFMIRCILNNFYFHGGFKERSKVLWKNAWPGHYPKGSAVSKIGWYLLEELFRVFFISNEWWLTSPVKRFGVLLWCFYIVPTIIWGAILIAPSVPLHLKGSAYWNLQFKFPWVFPLDFCDLRKADIYVFDFSIYKRVRLIIYFTVHLFFIWHLSTHLKYRKMKNFPTVGIFVCLFGLTCGKYEKRSL